MKALVLSLSVAATSLATFAQSTPPHPCQLKTDANERTECLLKAFPAVSASGPAAPAVAAPAPAAAAAAAEPRFSRIEADDPKRTKLYVHSSATVTDFGALDLGEDGAQFAGSRSDGDTAAVVDLGALVVFKAFNTQGWQAFAYGSWARDEAADEPSDLRTAGVGVRGFFSLFDTSGPGQRKNPRIYVTGNIAQRWDLYGDTDATQLGLKLNFLTIDLAEPPPGIPGFIPHVGWLLENRDAGGAATTDGTWSSLYLGTTFTYRLPGETLKGLSVTGLVRWFGDVTAPGDNDRRHDGFGKIKLTYDLYQDARSIAQPSLFLARQAGEDFLSGTSKAKTTFGLQIAIR